MPRQDDVAFRDFLCLVSSCCCVVCVSETMKILSLCLRAFFMSSLFLSSCVCVCVLKEEVHVSSHSTHNLIRDVSFNKINQQKSKSDVTV